MITHFDLQLLPDLNNRNMDTSYSSLTSSTAIGNRMLDTRMVDLHNFEPEMKGNFLRSLNLSGRYRYYSGALLSDSEDYSTLNICYCGHYGYSFSYQI